MVKIYGEIPVAKFDCVNRYLVNKFGEKLFGEINSW